MFNLKKKIKIDTDPKKINEIFNRGTIVEGIPNLNDLKKRMLSGERLRIYWGFDATAPTLHLSHAKNFMLLEKFRKLGHEVIILFGDFTAMIGDPTDKSASRKQLTRKEILKNVSQWKKLIKPLMGFNDRENPVVIKYNYNWLAKLSSEDWINLASNFTIQQMMERDMFQKRLKENKPIYMHEFFYPLMQGYDSVALDVDVEMCGTDQIFNALAGRTLLKRLSKKEKTVVVVTLMENPKTGKLMSKSLGTGVFLGNGPDAMFGETMAQDDEMIELLFLHNTHLSKNEIIKKMKLEPREAKLSLAFEITSIFYGQKKAKNAQENWIKQFSKKEIPNNLEKIRANEGDLILDILLQSRLISSKKEGKRKIMEGAVQLDGQKITDNFYKLTGQEKILKLGRKMVELKF